MLLTSSPSIVSGSQHVSEYIPIEDDCRRKSNTLFSMLERSVTVHWQDETSGYPKPGCVSWGDVGHFFNASHSKSTKLLRVCTCPWNFRTRTWTWPVLFVYLLYPLVCQNIHLACRQNTKVYFGQQVVQQADALGFPHTELWVQNVSFTWAESNIHFSATVILFFFFRRDLAVAVENFRSNAIPWHHFSIFETAFAHCLLRAKFLLRSQITDSHGHITVVAKMSMFDKSARNFPIL